MTIEVPQWVVRADDEGNLSILGSPTGVEQHRRLSDPRRWFTVMYGRQLPPVLDDLVELAIVVHTADRVIRRGQLRESNNGLPWQRCFKIQLPVDDPDRWSQPGITQRLTEALGFLTEDRWEFSFYPHRQRRRSSPVQRVLFPPEGLVAATHFSGGLDSLAGLALQLAQDNPTRIVAVTCSTNSRLLKRQRQLLRALHKNVPTRLSPLIIPTGLHQQGKSYNLNERSQRGRGFLFNVLGSVAALMAGTRELLVFENGIGSINLAFSEAQLGAQSSRATHPIALRKIELFLQALLGTKVHLRLPYLYTTKGQLCSRLRLTRFAALATQSISCDGFPPRLVGQEQCGVCTSCLLRRQALFSSGYTEDRGPYRYRHDVLSDLDAIPNKKLASLIDMLAQVERLRSALSSSTPWNDLAIEYPELQEVHECLTSSPEDNVRQELLAL
jgi:7-cyano-7-deazaguanine synthase in queuosine biosynthesis